MLINMSYPYKDCIAEINKVYEVTGEKPCVGILLFKDFTPNGKDFSYTNTYQNIAKILAELNPQKCRISFCEYNGSKDISS